MAELFDRYISPNWRKDTDNPKIWEKISDIPNEEIWREKQRRRVRLVQFIRKHLKTKQRAFLSPEQLNQIDSYLDPDALTIGFARRFATYKRASLLFTDMERLTELLNNKEIPLQIIIAGKAHPHDTQGKEAIQGIIQKVKAYKLEKRVVFVEDYDMVIARMMVKGCDIWLNNPIRPLEASGTSGMKAGLNGTLNLSVLDGWWDEGFDSNNGFAIGEGEEFENTDEQMIAESKLLYDIIEKTIIKMFYVRSENRVPESWVKMMKESISSISGQFSTTRMVKDYTNKFYVKAIKNYFVMTDNYAQKSKDLKIWKEHIKNSWDKVHISDVIMKESDELKVGDTVHVSAVVELGSLSPDDVKIQIFHGAVDHTGAIINSQTDDLHVTNHYDNHIYFEGKYTCVDTGKQGVTVRVIPFNENLINFTDMYLCKWADL
jgi:starch phosphorylase